MSRLIIKNLPKAITEEKLRKLFSQKGEITDIQLKYTPEGKFRQFCFIGYRTEEQAQEALNFFHNSCINTSKITVEVCSNLGDPNKPKSWSKYASDSNKNLKNAKEKQVKENDDDIKEKSKESKGIVDLLEEHKSDPLFEEYLATKLKNSVWSNDNIIENITDKIELKQKNKDSENDDESENETEDNKLANAKISDLEYMKSLMVTKPRQKTEKTPKEKIDLFTVKLRGLPYSTTKKDIKHFFSPLVPFSIRVPRKVKGFAYVGFKTTKHFQKALLKDRSFLSGKRISVLQYTKKLEDENANESVEKFKNVKWKDKEELLKNEEDIAVSGKIFVRNLSYTTTEDDLQKLFEKYGPVTEVNLPIDKTTRQIKGFGTITFVFPEHAAKAYCELDGSIVCGRMLHLLPVKTSDEINEKNNEDAANAGDYKKQKELKLKSEAGSSHNWNSLFVGTDTVANVVAETYGTTKENVLGAGVSDASSSNNKNVSAAVRLALGETQIVQSIKDYLEQHDIHLDAFQTNVKKRSKTTILVKNLPAQTEESEIRSLFTKFGPISRLILPPHGITAVVEFHEATEARQAFKKLAYSKFKHVPLYLEWAPENTFKTPKNENTNQKENSTKQDNETKQNLDNKNITENESNSSKSKDTEQSVDEQAEPDTVLFVKNLNFTTTDEILRKHFEKCGKICYANVATKKDPKHPGQKLSMGYGFVRYMLRSDCENALKTLQFSDLEGKSLELKRSSRTTENDVRTNASKKVTTIEQNGTKIVIRNIPFQANKYELRDLFVPFGEIKALRLPQKMTGQSHRGFGFVDFVTKNDAKRAFESLSQSTHLYGRRLVLEWAANESDDVDMLRKRTANQMQKVRGVQTSKKGRFDLSDDIEKEDD